MSCQCILCILLANQLSESLVGYRPPSHFVGCQGVSDWLAFVRVLADRPTVKGRRTQVPTCLPTSSLSNPPRLRLRLHHSRLFSFACRTRFKITSAARILTAPLLPGRKGLPLSRTQTSALSKVGNGATSLYLSTFRRSSRIRSPRQQIRSLPLLAHEGSNKTTTRIVQDGRQRDGSSQTSNSGNDGEVRCLRRTDPGYMYCLHSGQ